MPIVKKFYQLNEPRFSFVRPKKKIKVFCFYWSSFGRDQRLQFNSNTLLEIFFAKKALGMCLPYINAYFNRIIKDLFCKPQNSWILSFLLMPIQERSSVTVWEWKISKNFSCIESFKYVSTLCKKVFSTA